MSSTLSVNSAGPWPSPSTDLTTAAIAVGVITAVAIGVRFAYLFTVPYLVRLVDRRPSNTSARPRYEHASSANVDWMEHVTYEQYPNGKRARSA
ncbi:hypothetical protein ACIQ8D_30510 [Streptomyces sp. NPDC096094]|uniref:hypothetical protein n=1 Tax=Streptomyces sp. NPDC096094 TaxID=3366073 RepID=UPI003817C177